MRWDVFCRVIDNYGDIGVCWRLAADLAGRGDAVRLWLDDARALAWMAPHGAAGVTVLDWHAPVPEPGDVVVEAFGCDPPPAFVERLAAAPRPPVWINLEYLSAEPWVERSHGLPSPVMAGPARGLVKWFYFPGFGPGTGGLLREPGLLERRDRFDRFAWLDAYGIRPMPGERIVSLFCYGQAPVQRLLASAPDTPTLLLGAGAEAAAQLQRHLGPTARRGPWRALALPLLTQPAYDELLWSCDLNFVRGEDSFVRAQWAGRPFVWQAYPQHDGVHADKVEAFIQRLLARAPAGTEAAGAALHRLWRGWNGLDEAGEHGCALVLPDAGAWGRIVTAWCEARAAETDLAAALRRFVAGKR